MLVVTLSQIAMMESIVHNLITKALDMYNEHGSNVFDTNEFQETKKACEEGTAFLKTIKELYYKGVCDELVFKNSKEDSNLCKESCCCSS